MTRTAVRLRARTVAGLTLLLLTAGGLGACGGSDGDGAAEPDAAASVDPGDAGSDAGDSATGDPDQGEDDGDGDSDSDSGGEEGLGQAADETVCAADATAIPTPYDDAFPTAWTFPPDTVVYSAEDRESTGVIVTGVSTASFDDVLAYLNTDEVKAGFAISNGETEEDDAEADWTAEGYTGRWAIRKSATCEGETVIQVLAAAG